MAVVIPIIAALEPGVEQLIVKIVDKIFPPKTGPTKFDVAMTWFQSLFNGIVKVTPNPPPVPDQPTLAGWLQALVDTLNKQGVLKGPETVLNTSGVTIAQGIALLTWLQTAPIAIPGGKP